MPRKKNGGVGRSPTLRGVGKGGANGFMLSPPYGEAVRLWGEREAIAFTPYGLSPKMQKPQIRLGVVGRERLADRRFWKPDRRVERKVDLSFKLSHLTNHKFNGIISFSNPLKELPCLRRKVRRRVIFALNLTGKGSRSRRHKFTSDSFISCKG